MGYLGQEASFTGTQNNQRLSTTAAGGQINFSVGGGYSINALDVYRNGIKLSGGRDFRALDGVTVTLLSPANDGDIIEFVTFENFKREDVITGDGDATIRGNVTISGDLGITGSLNATVSNTATAGFSTVSGISTQVSGFLGVGVTGTNLNVTGVITANSFSGNGSGLTGIAATDDVSTNGLVVLGISTLAGATFSGVSTFSNNVTLQANLDLQDDDKILLGTGDDLEIYHSGTYNRSYIQATGTNHDLTIAGDQITLGNSAISETLADFNANGSVELYYNNVKKFETDAGGVIITGIATADGFRAGDNEKIVLGTGGDLEIYHDTNDSIIKDGGTGSLVLASSRVHALNPAMNEVMFNAIENGAVELYYDATKKFETTSGGAAVTGTITASTFGSSSQNAYGARTVQSGGSPSGGSDGDIYYIY